MNVHARRAAPALAAILGLFLGCTQDFDQFDPPGSSSTRGAGPSSSSSGTGGTGGAGGESTSNGGGGAGGDGGGVGGAGGLGGMGGSGGSPTEDCLDGIDNDNDKDPDCADSDCGNFECVDEAPNGWEGYFRMNTTPYPNMAPSMCPDGAAPAVYFDTPNPGDCSDCSCGAWENAACAPPPISCWDNTDNCMGGTSADVTPFVPDGTCWDVPGISNGNDNSCRLTGMASVMDQGSCEPSGGALMFPEPWMNQDDVCGPIKSGTGCGNKKACVPKGTGDYAGPVCIRKAGPGTCPAAYPNEVLAATGEVDDRACNACQCEVSGVTCSDGIYTVYNSNGCDPNTSSTSEVDSMSCVDVSDELDNGTGSIELTTAPQAEGGSCAESGGEPMGSVTPQGETTFCCQ
jgi:hypothetical protein